MGLKEVVNRVRDYRSTSKVHLDSIVDPAGFFIFSNAMGICGADKVLELVSQNADSDQGLAMFGTYAALIAAGIAANRYVILPVSRRIRNSHKKKIKDGEEAGAWSWVKTTASAGAFAAFFFLSNLQGAIGNYIDDAKRVIDAFARKGTSIEKVVEQEDNGIAALEEKIDDNKLVELEDAVNGDSRVYSTGYLEGIRLNGLFTRITGIRGITPEKMHASRKSSLHLLEKAWRYKFNREVRRLKEKGLDPKKNKNMTARIAARQLLEEYKSKEPTLTTFNDYMEEIEAAVKEVKRNMNWKRYGMMKGLEGERLELLKSISISITGKDIMAYSLTELMPAYDGRKNIAAYDLALRSRGKEFIESFPALGDSKTSFGPYQFTEYALYHADKEKRGASVANLALKKKKIVGSVADLRGKDHHKAAYLFAINNIANLIRDITPKQFKALKEKGSKKKLDIVKFIATSHHGPNHVKDRIARFWLDNNAEADFSVSCADNYRNYADKTEANFNAVYSMVK